MPSVGLIVLLIIGLVVYDYLGNLWSISLAIFIVGLWIVIWVFAEKHNKSLDNSIEEKIAKSTKNHLDALVRNRISMVTKDAYGVVDGKKWQTECNQFFNNVIAKSLDKHELERYVSYDENTKARMGAILEDIVARKQEEVEAKTDFDKSMDPYQYEHYCALLARKSGWDANATSGSGDQGVDVIARKAERTLVIQCKIYSQPVGNKAVQEVIAAREFSRANIAAVVSNKTYTKSAKALAHASQVHLWHHSDLLNLDNLLKLPSRNIEKTTYDDDIDLIL